MVAVDQEAVSRRFADFEAKARIRDQEIADEKALEEARRGNKDFVQMYPAGFARISRLLSENPGALRLWVFLAEHIDADTGGVVAQQDYLAEVLGVTVRSIRRWSEALEAQNALCRLRVGSGVYLYALSPDEVWKSWDKSKDYAVFRTRTLVKKSDEHNRLVHRRMTTLMKERAGTPELPLED